MSLNVNNINYNDFKNICRACMLNCDIKFTPTNEMSDVFYKLTNIHFETNENLPQQICLQCFDKIIDIQEFALRCKQTHTTLKECLNNLEKIGSSNQQNENIENSNDLQTILPNTVTIVKHEVEDIDDNSLNLTDPIEIKEEMIEETNEIPEESEINYDQSTNCFADALLIPNTSNFMIEKEKISNNVNRTDLIENANSSECSNTTNINLKEKTIEFIKVEHVTNDSSFLIENEQILNNDVNPSGLIECSKSSNQSKILKEHLRRPKCDKCSKTFKFFSQLKKHLGTHRDERPFKCKQCSKSFKYLPNMKRHIRTHSSERPYKCEQCSKAFLQSSYLQQHMRTHIDEHPFKCTQCSKSFFYSCSLKTHMRTHTGERPYKCNQCSKSFTQSSNLNAHILTHTDEHTFNCTQCSKSFINSYGLKKHMHTHTGERPHKCEQCSKSFAQLSNLKTHIRTHANDCPFKCTQCSKSFIYSCYLKSHMLTHTGERPYKCDQCPKTFTQSSNLNVHIRTHTAEYPYECKQCSRPFTHSSSLYAHMRKQHNTHVNV